MTVARRSIVRRAIATLAVALLGAVPTVELGGSAPADAAPVRPCPRQAGGQATGGAVAADEISAMATARACGDRVEVLGRRSERERVFANSDGSYTLEASAVPRRVRRADGSWIDVDPTLRRDGTRVRPTASATGLDFSAGGRQPAMRIASRGHELSLSVPWPLPAPTLDGPRATYGDVLPGVDLVLTARPQGFAQTLVIHTREAAANPQLRELRMGLRAAGLEVRAAAGGFVALDDAGAPVFTSPAPTMWDSAGGAGGVGAPREPDRPAEGDRLTAVPTRIGGGAVTLRPDRAVLDDPATVYPVYLDPQVEAGREDWAMVSSGFPDQEYYNFSPDEGVGWCDVNVESNCERNQVKRLAWEFGVSSAIHGTHVQAATFQSWETWAYDCTADPVQLWLTGAVSSATNWRNHSWMQQLDSVTVARKNGCTNGPGWVSFNAYEAVRQAASSGWSTVTLGLRAGNEGSMPGSWKRFRNDAQLLIKYNTVPAVPDELSTIGTSQQASCATKARINATDGARLSATVRDPDDGATVLARFEWQDLTAGTAVTAVPDTASVVPPHTFEVGLPPTGLPDGHTIQWRVRGFDGTDESGSSPWCQFVVDNATPGTPGINTAGMPAFPAAPPSTTTVGAPVTATFVPAAGDSDIVGYYYGVGPVETVPTSWAPAGMNGLATVPVVPVASGLAKNFLTVVAVDEAGNRSPLPPTAPQAPGTRQFRANAATTTAAVPGDATGDGRADVTVFADAGRGTSTLWRWDGATSGVSAPTALQDVATTYPTATTRVVDGDFDGDGRSDTAVLQQDGPDVRLSVQRSSGNGLFGAPAQVLSGWNISAVKLLAANFDADPAGRDDIGVVYNEGGYVFTVRMLVANGSPGEPTFAAPATWYTQPAAGGAAWADIKVFATDLDGDGRPDFSHLYQDPGCRTRMFTNFSSGTAFTPGKLMWDSGPGAWCWASTELVTGDFDADGRGDLVTLYDHGNCSASLHAFYGNADRTVTKPPALWTGHEGGWCATRTALSTVHADGDPRTDVAAVYACCGGYQTKVYTFASTGRSFAAPRRGYAGAIGPFGTRTNPDLLLGGSGTASSSAGWGWSVAGATDGTTGDIGWSSWCCQENDHTEWLELALPEGAPVNRVVLYPRGDAGSAGQNFPATFTIDVWDGSSWATVISRTGHPRPDNGAGQVFQFPTRTAEKIRITGTSLRMMQFAEVEAFGIEAPLNLALGAAATADSSCAPEEGPAKAVNGRVSGATEKWCSKGAHPWLQADLGASVPIRSITVQHASAGGEPAEWNTRDFDLSVSADGTTWTPVAQVRGNTASPTKHQVVATGRYVRLDVLTPTQTDDPAARIYELEVYQ
ncbi:discoidin domain-containing protein [Nucisporomicrobium flavum]|uniref:discoidin domain-containing protein n=1 Tax=Nucisporomicrobium flavum TaxID=2785915 RepID=UPI003C2ADA7B